MKRQGNHKVQTSAVKSQSRKRERDRETVITIWLTFKYIKSTEQDISGQFSIRLARDNIFPQYLTT